MSVKELKFLDDINKSENILKFENNELQFFHEGEEFFALNRSEAHLLMLYLQEHLK